MSTHAQILYFYGRLYFWVGFKKEGTHLTFKFQNKTVWTKLILRIFAFTILGPSLFEESTRKNPRKPKKSPVGNGKRLSSGSSSKSIESDGETGSVQDEQMVPILREPISTVRNEFAFSDLMRKMASKYQNKTPTDGATE